MSSIKGKKNIKKKNALKNRIVVCIAILVHERGNKEVKLFYSRTESPLYLIRIVVHSYAHLGHTSVPGSLLLLQQSSKVKFAENAKNVKQV